MSSMLLKPTPLLPFQPMAPKRDDTFWIGWPSVFHTAPPQPASNARMICPPEFAGGAEASQNGFGDTMPPQLVVRSAITCLRAAVWIATAASRPSADGVDDFLATVRRVAAREHASGLLVRPVRGPDHDPAALERDARGPP